MRALTLAIAVAACGAGCDKHPTSGDRGSPGPAAATSSPVTCAPTPTAAPIRPRAAHPRWLAIAAPELAEAIAPLAEQRRAQGFEVVVSTEPPAKAIAATDPPPDYILLVGDEVEPGATDRASPPWRVASVWRELYRWRAVQRPRFAADPLWGDRDGDLVPDLPVGRLPGRDPEAIAAMVAKIIAYEETTPSADSLRLPIWTGAAGYSRELDRMATTLLLGSLAGEGPKWARWEVLLADPEHPLTAWPPGQPALFTELLRGGGAMAFLMGHGNTQSFHSMRWARGMGSGSDPGAGGSRRFAGASIDYAVADAAPLASGPPAPPLVIFTCESGNFAASEPSLAEALLALPGGPVATLGATTESHPLTNYYSGQSLLILLGGGAERLGDLWLAAQHRALTAKSFLVEQALADAEGHLEDDIDTDELRRDQQLMYALLGDPATRLRLPAPLEASAAVEGGSCHWQATPPEGATALRVDFLPAGRTIASADGPAPDQATALARYRAADATFEFEPLAELEAGAPWRGEIARPGRLRLTALGPRGLEVRTIEITATE